METNDETVRMHIEIIMIFAISNMLFGHPWQQGLNDDDEVESHHKKIDNHNEGINI